MVQDEQDELQMWYISNRVKYSLYIKKELPLKDFRDGSLLSETLCFRDWEKQRSREKAEVSQLKSTVPLSPYLLAHLVSHRPGCFWLE